MHIVHVALGGCLTWPKVRFGLTEDTGGHIAYVLGAAAAQARRDDVSRVDIVTRAFDDVALGPDHSVLMQPIGPKSRILRLATDRTGYLAKETLAAERPSLRRAFRALIAGMDRPPDVIHAHFADALNVALPTARRHAIPLIYTPHSLAVDKARTADGNPALATRIAEERGALRRADAVIVSSRDEAERQVEGYGVDVAGRVHRVAPGIAMPACPPGTGMARTLVDPLLSDAERPMILAIARPVAKKNLAGLMRAWLGHRDLRARTNLVILAGQAVEGQTVAGQAGGCPDTRAVLAELSELAKAAPGRIALPPRHDPQAVPQMYRLAAQRRGVFVNPALHEPFGLTLLEAAQAGLPVVATCVGGPVDILGTLGHGLLVDPRDGAAIGDAIWRLIRRPGEWDTAARSGREGASAFDWDRWAARADRIYRGLHPVRRFFGPATHLLACDMDGTLTGCAHGAAAFSEWAETGRMPFVVATGRSISEAREVLAQWRLPEPDAFVTAVGTEIHRRDRDGRLSLCPDYAARLDLGWNRAAALDLIARLRIEMQPQVEQRRWKLACFGDAAAAGRLRRALADDGIEARVVFSHGRLIDVLAPRGGKAAAVGALAARWGLTLADCIAAGDSGNDADMLAACGAGILVGNALPETAGLSAAPGRRLLRTRGRHANGVLEGLERLGLQHARPAAGRMVQGA